MTPDDSKPESGDTRERIAGSAERTSLLDTNQVIEERR